MVAAAALAFAGGGPDAPALLLPDLDQLAPYDLALHTENGRTLLVFASAVANVGRGPLVIEGSRPTLAAAMTVRQVVVRSDGSRRSARIKGQLRYVRSPDHEHWHLLRFDRYELRRAADFALVLPDRKTGFCLGDRKLLDPPPRWTPRLPAFKTRCGLGRPGLYSVREGISVGYLDDYRPVFDGQELDVTHVRAGRYVLVHRVNGDRDLRETDYDNDAASVLIELRPGSVRVLARCTDTERCDG